MIQLLFRTGVPIVRSRWLSPTTQPDRTWQPEQRYLYPAHVFLPKNIIENQPSLPLLIDVHGGAFITNIPTIDDPVCRYLADHGHCLVISIDYRKAPQNPFPAGYDDVVEQIVALLSGSDFLFDREKVFLFGSSAGGNLVLGAAQDSRLRGKIAGVMALYPVTDSSIPFAKKMAARPDATVPDLLETSYDGVLEVYLGDGGSEHPMTKDVRASPGLFERREDLPKYVYLIGAEHDLLCKEAEVMAERLVEGEEKVPEGSGWKAGDVRWEQINGQTHGFDVFGRQGETKQQKVDRLKAKENVYESMAKWMREVASVG